MILDTLFKILPKELSYNIILFVPCFNITEKDLFLQQKRIFIYEIIRNEFHISDRNLKNFVFEVYNGGKEFLFEDEKYFIHISWVQTYDYHYSYFNSSCQDIDYICIFF